MVPAVSNEFDLDIRVSRHGQFDPQTVTLQSGENTCGQTCAGHYTCEATCGTCADTCKATCHDAFGGKC